LLKKKAVCFAMIGAVSILLAACYLTHDQYVLGREK